MSVEKGDRLYGLYEGLVISNVDPDGQNRLKVTVQGVYDEDVPVDDLPWCCASHPYTGNQHGELRTPNQESNVFVMFRQGDPSHPVWIGQPLYEGDLRNSDEHARINGVDRRDVSIDQQINIWGSQVQRIGGNTRRLVFGSIIEDVRKSMQIDVVERVTSTFGSWDMNVTGRLFMNIGAFLRLSVAGTLDSQISGDFSNILGGSFVVNAAEKIEMQAANTTQIPPNAAIQLTAVGGQLSLATKNQAGLSGGFSVMDALTMSAVVGAPVSYGIHSPQVLLGNLAPIDPAGPQYPAALAVQPIDFLIKGTTYLLTATPEQLSCTTWITAHLAYAVAQLTVHTANAVAWSSLAGFGLLNPIAGQLSPSAGAESAAGALLAVEISALTAWLATSTAHGSALPLTISLTSRTF